MYKSRIITTYSALYVMKELFSDNRSFRVTGRLWIESAEDRFLGPGRIELMEKISQLGSISKAAEALGMSYKKAWDLVNSMNQQASQPVVLTQAGGKKGGGAVVTETGQKAIEFYQALQSRFQQFMEQETQSLRE
jgi:molybdate transport system regulatory protein